MYVAKICLNSVPGDHPVLTSY